MLRWLRLACTFVGAPIAVAATCGALAAACSDDPRLGEPTADASDLDRTDGPGVVVDAAPDVAVVRDCGGDLDPDGVPKHLECTGLYSDFTNKTLAAGVRRYKPAVEFWSDGAEKQRFVRLPANAKIDTANFDEWVLPVGTKFWKEFRLGGKRIETRLYEKTATAWQHTVYRWSDDETEALRKEAGEKLPPSGARATTYEVPNTTQCNACHDGRKEPVLGFDALSLGLPGADGVTLALLAAEGLLSTAPPATKLTLPDNRGDGRAPAAVGWLHANCGACHNANPYAGAAHTQKRFLVKASELVTDAGAEAGVEQLDLYKSTVCIPSNRSDPDGGAPYLVISGREPTRSLASILAGRRVAEGEDPTSSAQMPPLVTRRVDEDGHAKLNAWIQELERCTN